MRKQLLPVITTLFLVFSLLVGSNNVQAQNDDIISLELRNVPLGEALKQFSKVSRYKVNYSMDDVSSYHVTVSIKNMPSLDAFRKIIGQLPFSYEVDGRIISLKKGAKKVNVSGRTRVISGTVKDEDGESLIGVHIFIGENDACGVTDANGYYSFKIPVENTRLKYSYVGMKTMYFTIPQDSKDVKMNVKMNSDNQLNEVVVTGIFNKAKESYTGSASTITSKELRQYRGQNLLQTLKNVDVSINMAVNNVAGSDPNTLPQISIRGNSSLPVNVQEFNTNIQNTVNTPLIVMDGFEISLTKLMDYNDDEIESINILKDAAATAIYGSRGANGVIVIISKQPEAGRLRVNAEIGFTAEIPDISSYDMLNAKEKLKLENDLGLYHNKTYELSDISLQNIYNRRLKTVLSGVDTDWLSKPLHNGFGSNNRLRIEGGSKEFKWSVDAGYKNIQGAMKGSKRENFNGGMTLMYSSKNLIYRDYLSVGVNRSHQSKYGSFSDYVIQEPYDSPYDEDGKLVRYFETFNGILGTKQNPLYDASLNQFNKTGYNEITNNFSIEWHIIPELILRGQFNISNTHNTSDYFLPAEHSYFNSATYQTEDGLFRKGLYRYGTGNANSYDGNITLSYNKTFAKKHTIYFGVNYALTQSKSDFYTFAVEGFTSSDIHNIGSALQYEEGGKPTSSDTKVRRMGITSNLNYIYDNRYYVDLSYREDGSSSFGSDKKYAPFWSAGIGWNVHNEHWFRNDIFNTLRLKLSYGTTGSMNVSETGAKTVYKYITDNRYLNRTGVKLLGLGNSDLTWQKTKETNIGLEFGLLKNRIRGSFEYYTKRTNNLLSYMDMPLSSGFSSYLANVGEVKNQGWELALNGYIIRNTKKGLIWSVGGQLTYNRNRITKLSDAIKAQNEAYLAQDVDVSNLFYEGRPQNAIYAVRSQGIDPSSGQELFIDKDGNLTTEWNASDKVYLGSSVPTYRGIANSMFQWKGFTFNMSFSYYWGGKTYNQTLVDRVEVSYNGIANNNVDKRVLYDRWMKEGDVKYFKAVSYLPTRASSRFVMNDNVLDLQSISLQYELKNNWLQNNLRFSSLIFGINANDIAHWGSIHMERGTSYPYSRNIQGSMKFVF